MGTRIQRIISDNIYKALKGSNNPSLSNVFATLADIGGGGGGGGTNILAAINYSALPLASANSGIFYWLENSEGTAWLPGSLGGTYYPKGLYYSNGTNWITVDSPINATQIEVNAGLNDNKFVTPKTLKDSGQWDTKANSLGADDNYVTDAEKTLLSNTSGTNTGDIVVKEIEIDFGTLEDSNYKFTINDVDILNTNIILPFPSPNEATNRVGNDWEVETATFTGKANTGNFILTVSSDSTIVGNRKIFYQII